MTDAPAAEARASKPSALERVAAGGRVVERVLATSSLVVSGLALILLLLVVSSGVLTRILPGSGLFTGQSQLGGVLLVALVFTGLTIASKGEGFARVTFLYNRVHGRPLLLVDVVLLATALGYGCLLSWYAWDLALTSLEFSVEDIGAVTVPLGIPQMVMALGLTVFSLDLAVTILLRALPGNEDINPLGHMGPVTFPSNEGSSDVPRI